MTDIEEMATAVIAQKLIEMSLEAQHAYNALRGNVEENEGRFFQRRIYDEVVLETLEGYGFVRRAAIGGGAIVLAPNMIRKALAIDADRVEALCKRARAMTRHMVEAPKAAAPA